jgi:hypothetical protein
MWNPWKRANHLEWERDMTAADLQQVKDELADTHNNVTDAIIRNMKLFDALAIIADMEKPGSSAVAKRMAAVAREALAE